MTRPDLIAAVLADPDALWAVLTSGVKVAGAWDRSEPPPYSRSVRREPDVSPRVAGDEIAVCQPYNTSWTAWVRGVGTAEIRGPLGVRDSVLRAKAEAWCDARLREAGWILAGGEP